MTTNPNPSPPQSLTKSFNVAGDDENGHSILLCAEWMTRETAEQIAAYFRDTYVGKAYPNGQGYYTTTNVRIVTDDIPAEAHCGKHEARSPSPQTLLVGEADGYKHILHASDGHKTVVVDDNEEHPFGDELEEGDRVESIPLFRSRATGRKGHIAALQEWSEQKYGQAFSTSACHDLLNVLRDADTLEQVEPLRDLVERAQAIISTSTYPNWHATASAALATEGK